jgi:hypothetical protein
MIGNYKFAIVLSWQFGLMLAYHDKTVVIELPLTTIAYSWGSNAHGFKFINLMKGLY